MSKSILIICGHGGNDTGALAHGDNERDSVIPHGKSIYDKLKSNGFNVSFENNNTPLKGEIELANKYNYDIIISYHRNSYNGLASGFEVLHHYKSLEGKKLSTIINNKVVAMGYKSRGVKSRDNLGILNQTKGVSIILELDFIDFLGDEITIKDSTEIVYSSLCDYLNIKQVCKTCGK